MSVYQENGKPLSAAAVYAQRRKYGQYYSPAAPSVGVSIEGSDMLRAATLASSKDLEVRLWHSPGYEEANEAAEAALYSGTAKRYSTTSATSATSATPAERTSTDLGMATTAVRHLPERADSLAAASASAALSRAERQSTNIQLAASAVKVTGINPKPTAPQPPSDPNAAPQLGTTAASSMLASQAAAAELARARLKEAYAFADVRTGGGSTGGAVVANVSAQAMREGEERQKESQRVGTAETGFAYGLSGTDLLHLQEVAKQHAAERVAQIGATAPLGVATTSQYVDYSVAATAAKSSGELSEAQAAHLADLQRQRDLLMDPMVLAAARARAEATLAGISRSVGEKDIFRNEEYNLKAYEVAQQMQAQRDVNKGKIDLGGGLFVDPAEVEAVSRRIVSPVLEEIEAKAAAQRAADEEKRAAEAELAAQQEAAAAAAAQARQEAAEAEAQRKAEERHAANLEKEKRRNEKTEQKRLLLEQQAAAELAALEERKRHETEKASKKEALALSRAKQEAEVAQLKKARESHAATTRLALKTAIVANTTTLADQQLLVKHAQTEEEAARKLVALEEEKVAAAAEAANVAQQAVEAANAELAELKKRDEENTQEYSELVAHVAQLEANSKEVAANHEALKAEYEELREAHEATAERLKEAETKAAELGKTLEDSEAQLAEFDEEIRKKEEASAELEAQMAKLEVDDGAEGGAAVTGAEEGADVSSGAEPVAKVASDAAEPTSGAAAESANEEESSSGAATGAALAGGAAVATAATAATATAATTTSSHLSHLGHIDLPKKLHVGKLRRLSKLFSGSKSSTETSRDKGKEKMVGSTGGAAAAYGTDATDAASAMEEELLQKKFAEIKDAESSGVPGPSTEDRDSDYESDLEETEAEVGEKGEKEENESKPEGEQTVADQFTAEFNEAVKMAESKIEPIKQE